MGAILWYIESMVKKTSSANKNTLTTIREPLWRRHFHSVLAFLYFIQAGLIFLFSATRSVNVTGSYMSVDTLASNAGNGTVFAPAVHHVFDANLGGIVVTVLLLAAITHAFLAVGLKKKSQKDENIQTAQERRIRWIGLGASMVVAFYLVALVLGVRDITALIPLLTLCTLVAIAGYLLESRQQISRRVIYSLTGLAALIPWIVLGIVVFMSAQYGSLSASAQWIFASTAAFSLLLYGGVYSLYAGKRPLKLEAAIFMSLTMLVLQSALAWQVYAGFLHN